MISFSDQDAAIAAALPPGDAAHKNDLRAALAQLNAGLAAAVTALNQPLDVSGVQGLTAALNTVQSLAAAAIPAVEKGAAGGVAPLNAGGKLDADYVQGLTAALNAAQSLAAAAIPAAEKGASGGVAPLNAGGKLDVGYLPPTPDLTRRVTVADDAARLALPAYDGFRIVAVTATGLKWAINGGDNPSVAANWISWPESLHAAEQIAATPGGGLTGITVAAQLGELAAAEQALATADQALASRVTSLETQPTAADQALATAEQALAARVTALETQPTAADQALATAEQALATRVTSLETQPTAADQALATRVTALETAPVVVSLSNAAPINIGVGAASAAAAGSGSAAARADHSHILRLSNLPAGTLSGNNGSVVVARPNASTGVMEDVLVDLTSLFTGRTLTSTVVSGGTFTQPRLTSPKYTNRTAITAASGSSVTLTGVSSGSVVEISLYTLSPTITLPAIYGLIGSTETFELIAAVHQDGAVGGQTVHWAVPAGYELRWGPSGEQPPNPDGLTTTLYSFFFFGGAQRWCAARIG